MRKGRRRKRREKKIRKGKRRKRRKKRIRKRGRGLSYAP